jgi:NifB/MoaA-like Fe-S oxidoreductase
MSYDGASAASVLGMVQDWQTRLRPERGVGWVYAADELYIVSGVPMPQAAEYDDFCQFENGIGMVAAFAEELPSAPTDSRRTSGDVTPASGGSLQQPGPPGAGSTIVTGELFAPVLRALLDDRGWRGARVLAARNDLFGGNVGVTGLLGGRDITRTIADDGRQGYLVPDVVVNSDGLLIDDVSAGALAASAGADVRIVGSDAISLSDALARG